MVIHIIKVSINLSEILYCLALHRIALYRIASHCIALHRIALHCIALHSFVHTIKVLIGLFEVHIIL